MGQRQVTIPDRRLGVKRRLQRHFQNRVLFITLFDVAVEKGPFHELHLLASRLAIRRELPGMREAERRQREQLLMTGNAILFAPVSKERGGGSLGGLFQRR